MATRCAALVVLTVGLVLTTGPTIAGGAAMRQVVSNGQAMRRAVPLSVQRLLKKRVPAAAYVPTRLPVGYRFVKFANLNHTGFDVYFGCCPKNGPLLGFDAVLVTGAERCSQGTPAGAFRIDGVIIYWSTRLYSRWAWRCIRHAGSRLLVTVSDGQRQTLRELARIAASVRAIR